MGKVRSKRKGGTSWEKSGYIVMTYIAVLPSLVNNNIPGVPHHYQRSTTVKGLVSHHHLAAGCNSSSYCRSTYNTV